MVPIMRTRVKICGLTREQDIAAALDAGVDAIGFVFYAQSKRYVSPARAAQLRREIPAFVDVVALFVNSDPAQVEAVQDQVGPELLQFHGDESLETCTRYKQRFLRAFRVGAPGLGTAQNLARVCAPYGDAAGWLFDSFSSGYGGSGLAFEHTMLDILRAEPKTRPIVLSGGLNAQNIGQAIRTVRPWAVDVSSGVEIAAGIKSSDKIHDLFKAIALADQACEAKT